MAPLLRHDVAVDEALDGEEAVDEDNETGGEAPEKNVQQLRDVLAPRAPHDHPRLHVLPEHRLAAEAEGDAEGRVWQPPEPRQRRPLARRVRHGPAGTRRKKDLRK